MSEPQKDFATPSRIWAAFFQGDVSLGFMSLQSATIDPQASSRVDKIVVVSAGEYQLPGGSKLRVGDGLVVERLQQDRTRPGAPKTLFVGFTPWSNVKSVLYG